MKAHVVSEEKNDFEKTLLETTYRKDTPCEENPIKARLYWDGIKYFVSYTHDDKSEFEFEFYTYEEAFRVYKELVSREVSIDELCGTEPETCTE